MIEPSDRMPSSGVIRCDYPPADGNVASWIWGGTSNRRKIQCPPRRLTDAGAKRAGC